MRVGVVGTGYLGRLHARILTEIPSITAAGFVETNDEIANEVATNLKLKRFDSIAQLAKEVDAAIVATPTTTHYDVARELLDAGVDVMIEKPVTRTVDQARRLIDLAKSRNRIIQVGHVERYNPGALPGEEPHRRGADAAGAAGDDGDLAVQAKIQHGGSVY